MANTVSGSKSEVWVANKARSSDTGTPESSFLEKNVNLSREICIYLETQDICRVISCSHALKKQVDVPRLWQMVAPTLELPNCFWPDRTKKTVRANLAMLKRVSQTFAFCCSKENAPGPDEETLRAKMVKFAKLEEKPDFDKGMALENPRACFTRYTRPVVNAMRENSPTPCEALHEILLSSQAFADRILEMFYACGDRGTGQTLNYITGYPLYCSKLKSSAPRDVIATFDRIPFKQPKFIHIHTSTLMLSECAHHSDAVLCKEALELILKYGEPPETFVPLLVEYDIRPQKRLAEIIRFLVEQKGEKLPPGFYLRQFLLRGPLELVKFFIEKTNVKIAPDDLSSFLYALTRRICYTYDTHENVEPLTVEYVIAVLDLMKKRQPEVRAFQPPNGEFSDNFGSIAYRYNDSPDVADLLDKLIEVGIAPINDDSPFNSLRCALTAKAPYGVILLLRKYGATLSPEKIRFLIEITYQDQPQLQEQLFQLFGFGS